MPEDYFSGKPGDTKIIYCNWENIYPIIKFPRYIGHSINKFCLKKRVFKLVRFLNCTLICMILTWLV
jgi:hypothetical protein